MQQFAFGRNSKFSLWLLLWVILMAAMAPPMALVKAQATHRKARKCLLPAQSGRCFGYVPSFAYNPFMRKCEEFVYGGCSGNDNRFDTKIDCEKACRGV